MTRVKRPVSAVYTARDRQDAARVLRAAKGILMDGGDPFPVLEAARRTGVKTSSQAWALAAQARDTVGGPRDESQLEAAAALVENRWSPDGSCRSKLTRVPRCHLRATGGRCARPLSHDSGCALTPSLGDLVRSVGTDHVLVGGPPSSTAMIIAWEAGAAGDGRGIRMRRDDHARGIWIDFPSGCQRRREGKPLLLGWTEIRRLALELNLELADQRGVPPAGRSARPHSPSKEKS